MSFEPDEWWRTSAFKERLCLSYMHACTISFIIEIYCGLKNLFDFQLKTAIFCFCWNLQISTISRKEFYSLPHKGSFIKCSFWDLLIRILSIAFGIWESKIRYATKCRNYLISKFYMMKKGCVRSQFQGWFILPRWCLIFITKS